MKGARKSCCKWVIEICRLPSFSVLAQKVVFKQGKSNQGDGDGDVDERKRNLSSGVAFIWPKKVLKFLDSDGKMKI